LLYLVLRLNVSDKTYQMKTFVEEGSAKCFKVSVSVVIAKVIRQSQFVFTPRLW